MPSTCTRKLRIKGKNNIIRLLIHVYDFRSAKYILPKYREYQGPIEDEEVCDEVIK
jgi:hypothetical protein